MMGRYNRKQFISSNFSYHYYSYFIISSIVFSTIILWIQPVHGASNEQYLDTIGCSSGKQILLSQLPNNTLTLKLSRWSDYHLASSFLNFHCKFKVVAPRGQSLMAVIQGLNLRRKTLSSEGCRDYIKMEQGDGMDTGSICGEVDIHDVNDRPAGLVGPRYFYEQKGTIEVTFSIDESPGGDSRKPIFLQLIFTSYSDCTSTSISTQRVRKCSNSRTSSCIPANLFCDGIVNCGFRGSDFAADEKDCAVLTPARKFDENVQSGDHLSENSLNSDKSHGTHLSSSAIFVKITPAGTTATTTHNEEMGKNSGNHAEDEMNKITSSVHTIGLGKGDGHNSEVPLPITIALISAISGALMVLVVLFFCCCVGRKLDRLNRARNNEELGIRTNNSSSVIRSSPSQGFELSVTHSSGNGGNATILMRDPTGQGIIGKPTREDLPPPYDAIFPKAVPEKK